MVWAPLRHRIPLVIVACFAMDLLLGGLYLLNYLMGAPYDKLSSIVNLGGEGNLPTWFSSVQWFSASALLGVFGSRHIRREDRSSWLLAGLPLVFALMSLDEIARIHEWLGQKSDALLPGGDRSNTPFSRTGIWMFLIGLPFLLLFIGLIASIRRYFRHAGGALAKLVLGVLVLLAGAAGVETLSNFVSVGSGFDVLQDLTEELMELIGGTIVLWAAFDLLGTEGNPSGPM